MKTATVAVLLLACQGVMLKGAEPVEMAAHEWGTFTIVSGSSGGPLRWYQPDASLSELPDFVEPRNLLAPVKLPFGVQLARKSGPAAYMRMETPVIYFYPEKATSVQVQVGFPMGRLTEWFPPPSAFPNQDNPNTIWKGELLPPSDESAKVQMPVLTGTKGAHYAHAREVPDAWFFRATQVVSEFGESDEIAKAPKRASPTEKFIFYRGAGDVLPPMYASLSELGTFTLQSYAEDKVLPVAFALSVSGDNAIWTKVPTSKESHEVQMMQATPNEKGIASLATALTAEIVAAGLTSAEAKAMVATWSDVWFKESGDRLFVLLPQAWVDKVLPLNITPAPKKLTRVFRRTL